MTLELHEIFSKAADLVEQPGAWVQGVSSLSKTGRIVGPNNKHAVCWCAMGAIARVTKGHGSKRAIQELTYDVSSSVSFWNDNPAQTQANVVAHLRLSAAKRKPT